MTVVVGVDIGGTKIAAATVSAKGDTGSAHILATPSHAGADAVLDAAAAAMLAAADGEPIEGTGVATAGTVRDGVIVSATDSMSGWEGTDVAGGIRRRLSLAPNATVTVQNDATAHGRGEAWRGAASGASSALVLAIGTGIGGAVIVDDEILPGAHHAAGSLGHVPSAEAVGMRCPCGRSGHLEAIAAGPSILRLYLAVGGDPAVADSRELPELADRGDQAAALALSTAGRATGQALAGLITAFDPEVVVVGGSVAGAGAMWWGALESAVARELTPPFRDVTLVRSSLGASAAILGAAGTVWQLKSAVPA